MEELENIDLDHEDPIGVLKIIKRKLRLKTKDFATILDVPVVKITKLLAKNIRLTEDEAKKLATHFDVEIFYFGRWYRIDSDPDYWNDSKIRNEIISLTNYLRLGYEKLVTENTNHHLVPIWKETWGDWINNYYCITDGNGGLSLETKEAVSYEINWLKKEKKKLHATINEIKKYDITDTTKNKLQ